MERLTIDEAIKDFRYCAKQNMADLDINFAKENNQISEWLKELKSYKATNFTPEQVVEMAKELGEYKSLENEGLLLKFPCKVGDTVYCIHGRDTKCSAYNERFEEYNCQGCELECDSKKEYYIAETIADAFFCALCTLENRFGKTVFLTQAKAEAKLKEMEGE